jgi:hypothetical protein
MQFAGMSRRNAFSVEEPNASLISASVLNQQRLATSAGTSPHADRRLNTIFEREHLVAFIEITFISILSRRLVRLVIQEISA